MIIGKKLVATGCALLMTTSAATGVFATDDFSKELPQQNDRPAQEVMQDQNNKGFAPAAHDTDFNNNNDRPVPQEMNGENKPADLPEMNGENKPADLPEMKDGKHPSGPREAEDVRNELGKSGDSSNDEVSSLINDYSNAVDAERNATDSDSKLTAAKMVKELADAINSVLEKLGLSVRINTPAEKPEVPAASQDQGSAA